MIEENAFESPLNPLNPGSWVQHTLLAVNKAVIGLTPRYLIFVILMSEILGTKVNRALK